MIVKRWQAQVAPTKKQVIMLYQYEGLKPYLDEIEEDIKIEGVKSPFCLIRTIIEGELEVNISGNIILLRSGDKLILPSNTKHSLWVKSSAPCISVCAKDIT